MITIDIAFGTELATAEVRTKGPQAVHIQWQESLKHWRNSDFIIILNCYWPGSCDISALTCDLYYNAFGKLNIFMNFLLWTQDLTKKISDQLLSNGALAYDDQKTVTAVADEPQLQGLLE